VLDGIGFGLHCVGYVSRVAGMNCQRKALGVGFLRDGIKETCIQAIEDAAGRAGFQNGFDAVDVISLQSIDLLAGFVGRLRDAIELLQEALARGFGYLIENFRAVSARRRK
jgi:hypothetical protein